MNRSFLNAVLSRSASALTLCTLVACASSRSRDLVAKATAYDTYFQARYAWECVDQVGPSSCLPCQIAINDAARLVPLANQVQKIHALPKKEADELTDLVKRLEACP